MGIHRCRSSPLSKGGNLGFNEDYPLRISPHLKLDTNMIIALSAPTSGKIFEVYRRPIDRSVATA